MTSAYIQALKREVPVPDDQPEASTDLRQSFLDWYANLPPVSRNRSFAMVEIEQALGTQGKYLSPILLSLGWQRKRKWTGRAHYSRYWVPPSNS